MGYRYWTNTFLICFVSLEIEFVVMRYYGEVLSIRLGHYRPLDQSSQAVAIHQSEVNCSSMSNLHFQPRDWEI